jgi:hypothetical protein
MSDIDATVEFNNYFLFMEWKSHNAEIPTGQRIYFERLTAQSERNTVVIVNTDKHPEDISSVQVIKNGKLNCVEPCDLEGLRRRIKKWAERIESF